jgi:hypothetical protein
MTARRPRTSTRAASRKWPSGEKFYLSYISFLSRSCKANYSCYREHFRGGKWTKIAIAALRNGCRGFAPDRRIATKGKRDQDGRAEYLNLDLVAWKDLGAPIVIAEHEYNDGKLDYSTWKLLCVEAKLRVLVCYFPCGDPDEKSSNCQRFLKKRILPVLRLHQLKRLLIIVGDPNARLAPNRTWTNVFSPWIGVGPPTKEGDADIIPAQFQSNTKKEG